MKTKVIASLSALFISTSILTGCNNNSNLQAFQNIQNTQQNTQNRTKVKLPTYFSQKKTVERGGIRALNMNSKNSFATLQRKMVKLHKFFFSLYSNDREFYTFQDEDNKHLNLLSSAESDIGEEITLDPNFDDEITWDEIQDFVTNKSYISYFGNRYIKYFFVNVDGNKDNEITLEEFFEFDNLINEILTDLELDLEAAFSEYDYNSNEVLELKEFEDFYLDYLLLKYTKARQASEQ